MKSLISVIVPVYNVEQYVQKCLSSILNQTYTNIEIIVVDDGSTDNSYDICKNIATKDARIKLYTKANGGLSSARNYALDRISGEYICFVDSDDYIDKQYIQKLYSAIKENNCDMSICSFVEEGVGNCSQIQMQPAVTSGAEILKKMAEPLGYKYVVVWNKLYAKRLFDDVRFIDGKIHEDQYIAHQLLLPCKKVVVIADKLYHYVNRDNSITANQNILNHIDDIHALLNRAQYMISCGYIDIVPYVEKQLRILANHYLSASYGRQNYTFKQIRFIKNKYKQCLKLAKWCLDKCLYDKQEFKQCKKVYKITFIKFIKLKF